MATAVPAWQPHPEVWLLVASIIAFGWYASHRIQPNAVAAGGSPITASQRRWFVFGVIVLWVGSDWPLHDIAEERLYSAHMVQHLLLTFVVPPAFLMATPEWLGRFLLGEGALERWFHRLTRPIPAAIGFNVMVALSHWSWIVNNSVKIGPLHYSVHTLIVGLAFLVWTSICGPFPELRVSLPVQMVSLFLLSVIPTIPAGWLTNAEGVLYSAYDHPPRLFGLSVTADQQLAGVIMKLGGGIYLWAIIITLFFRWMNTGRDPDKRFRGTFVPTVTSADGRPSENEAGSEDTSGSSTAVVTQPRGSTASAPRVPAESP